jgi:hypothetical protein
MVPSLQVFIPKCCVKITLYYTGFKKTVCIVMAERSSLKRKNRSTFLSVITASKVNLG